MLDHEGDASAQDSQAADPNAENAAAQGSPSWTAVIPRTEHNAIFLDCDYGPTPLGPIKDWGPALRLYASMVFTDSRGACVYWGPNKTAFYNENFAVCCGGAHPYLMGRGFQDAFSALWEQMGPVFEQAAATAKTVDVDNILLFPWRNGFMEETYFIGQFIPLRGDDGEVAGFYNTVYESTGRVLYERRRVVVDRIATIHALSVDETISSIIDALRANANDITMALLYSFEELTPGGPNLHLKGSVGVPEGHPCAPLEMRLESSSTGLVQSFRRVQLSSKPLVLSEADGSLPRSLFEGIQWCGYGEPSRDVVIVPLMISGNLLGFYVQGTNPRREYDEATQMNIIDMARQMESKWNASITTEQAKNREQTLERRALDIENRLSHMVKWAPIGMCQVGPDHKIQWANEQFYQITGHDRSRPDMAAFRECIAPESRHDALHNLGTLLDGAPLEVREYRLVRKWEPPVRDEISGDVSAWMLTSSFPLMEKGEVKVVLSYITEISHQKWAESIQTRLADVATEAKHRQERFIDIVSHELRNPLSAISQLADGIGQSINGMGATNEATYQTVAEESVEAASTILACAAHQKRVIDDVLILSRLDSQMLSITPVVERPLKIAQDTVKMFVGESTLNNTEFRVVRDKSYDDLRIDYVHVDTSRLAQILINLISNAIKFTTSPSVRKITLTLGARLAQPPQVKTDFGELEWITPLEQSRPETNLKPLQDGEEILYLYFCVQDTGVGLTSTEMQRLFKRFSQASAKTHVTYGGSGLGLYICRELAEKQGGGVGVASRRSEGSVFAFYIETRHALGPERTPDQHSLHPSDVGAALSKRLEPSSRTQPSVEATDRPPSSGRGAKFSVLPYRPSTKIPTQQQRTFHVLLVEDNIINQKVLAKQLRAAKCTVTVANHGKEALAKLQQADCWKKPDAGSIIKDSNAADQSAPLAIEVILMDLEMPIMNGLDCCKRIRVLESEGQITKRLPVIAITANVRQEQKDMATRAGMDRVLSKPFVVSELLEIIRYVLPDG